MAQLIEEEAVVALFGSEDGLRTAIVDYQKALKAHAKTVGIAAPTTHPFVELIVKKSGGKFKVVPTAKPEPPPVVEAPAPAPVEPPPPPTLDDKKEAVRRGLADLRRARRRQGVVYKGHRFAGYADTIAALTSAYTASQLKANTLARWKDADGGYIVLERSDMLAVAMLLQNMVQGCFDNEYRLLQLVEQAKTEKDLRKVDVASGWPE